MNNIPQWVKDAKAGDKVVCVRLRDGSKAGLRLNAVYTISEVLVGFTRMGEKTIGFNFVEISVCKRMYPTANGFIWSCFKPLQKHKTDISIFTEMLEVKELEQC